MKRVILAVVSTVASLVLLLSFKTHSPAAVATPSVAVSTPSTPSTSASTGTSSTKTTTKVYTGSASYTRYGPVQVRITVTGGKLAGATAVVYPMNDPRDAQINSYAIPQLESETRSAGSAHIDMISGATFTSQGYIASLQSALDQAGL